MAVPIDCGTNLADILSNALPPDKRSHEKDKPLSDSSVSLLYKSNELPSDEIQSNNTIKYLNYRMEAVKCQSQQVLVASAVIVHIVKPLVLNFITPIPIPL